MNKTLITIVLALLLSACSFFGPKVSPAKTERPAWIDNPEMGVSASAGFHVKGEAAQEALAITRAREEFAKRHGVLIESVHLINQVVVNDRATTVSDKEIRETVKGKEARAMVKAKWQDSNGVLWVWLVPSN